MIDKKGCMEAMMGKKLRLENCTVMSVNPSPKAVRKSAKEKRDELAMTIREYGQWALRPCDLCVRTKEECMVANNRSKKCSKCIGRAAPGCNAIPCMFCPIGVF